MLTALQLQLYAVKRQKSKSLWKGAVVFLSAHAPNLTYEDLKDRLENFKQIMPGQRSSNTRTDPQQQMKDLKMKYYRELKKLYELELEKSSAHPSKNYEQQDLDKSIKPAKKDVERSERVLNLKDRWKPNCQEYKEVASWQTEKKCLKPRKERSVLSKKIDATIANSGKLARRWLEQYNEASCGLGPLAKQWEFNDISNLRSSSFCNENDDLDY
ncbi:hypothetical protein VTP01DRAFT_130 [Rhizomucor pusillus]|uniref:uncharacterized protein n=1 Tax=Rhizomucor pusillus TaxID=4840 RepID=UPI0037425FF2